MPFGQNNYELRIMNYELRMKVLSLIRHFLFMVVLPSTMSNKLTTYYDCFAMRHKQSAIS